MCSTSKRQMHPRNIFRNPPDYTDLAIKYANFRKVCKLELTGKVSIDYKNEDALRGLTQMLLEEYFQLQVDFAPGSLIPTLPLRLNYILWLEDLLNGMKVPPAHIKGIDIGCGSSCIYSLLAAKKNKWHMFALESNTENISFAHQNVEINNLGNLIQIFEQKDKEVILSNFFEAQIIDTDADTDADAFHFCLCNPPFFDSSLSLYPNSKTRNPSRRAPPHNCHTGHAEELSCQGGEVYFVQRIIEESLSYTKRVCIYTSMLGHKSSLSKVLEILQGHNILNFTTTEFCQGNTTRWGVAWSFMDSLALKNIKL